MADAVPPVPNTKFSENEQRDFIIKEYLEKLKAKCAELEARILALGG